MSSTKIWVSTRNAYLELSQCARSDEELRVLRIMLLKRQLSIGRLSIYRTSLHLPNLFSIHIYIHRSLYNYLFVFDLQYLPYLQWRTSDFLHLPVCKYWSFASWFVRPLEQIKDIAFFTFTRLKRQKQEGSRWKDSFVYLCVSVTVKWMTNSHVQKL